MIIGSFQSFFNLVKRKPEIFNIPSLKGLESYVDAMKVATRGRTCGSCALSGVDVTPYKTAFENTFEALQGEDLQALKKLFNASKIEYYVKNPVTKLTETRSK